MEQILPLQCDTPVIQPPLKGFGVELSHKRLLQLKPFSWGLSIYLAFGRLGSMKTKKPSYQRHRFPSEIISHAAVFNLRRKRPPLFVERVLA